MQEIAREKCYLFLISVSVGHAVAQVVSHWLLIAMAQDEFQLRSCGICGAQSGTGAGFLRVFWFPLPIQIPAPHAPFVSSVILGCCSGPFKRKYQGIQSHPTIITFSKKEGLKVRLNVNKKKGVKIMSLHLCRECRLKFSKAVVFNWGYSKTP
jgi:hypothetical protein